MHCTDAGGLDRAVEAVGNVSDRWARLSIRDRLALLRECIAGSLLTAGEVVAAGCEVKRLNPRSPASGEEWMSGPVPVIRSLRLLAETLDVIHRAGQPDVPGSSIRRAPTGQLAVNVFPLRALDRVMYPGTRIDVWMQPGLDEEELRRTMASSYAGPDGSGQVAVVLGAGNVASIAPMDVTFKLFVEKQVVVLKMHPVGDYLGAILERAFRPLIERGYLRVVKGGAEEGQYLIHHAGVDQVHMTGSTAVHDRIVWGDTPEEQARRRTRGEPRLAKRITSELGCVTPVIVVPGRWSDAELQYQAEHVATMVAHSVSCTCTSARLLVTSRNWAQRQAFLERVADVLSRHEPRYAYYPGAAARYERFLASHPQSRRLGAAAEDMLACATIYDVDPAMTGDVVFREEAWSPVLAETGLAASDDAEFLDEAVRFCNDRVFGTLSVVLLVHPQSRVRLGDHIDRAVAGLRYGTVAVNQWSAVSFGLGVAPWGAYPGHTLDDVGSGLGFVHNTLMFERPWKTVVWGAFTTSPKPPWFTLHRRAHTVGRKMAAFEASPAWWRLPGIALPALRPG